MNTHIDNFIYLSLYPSIFLSKILNTHIDSFHQFTFIGYILPLFISLTFFLSLSIYLSLSFPHFLSFSISLYIFSSVIFLCHFKPIYYTTFYKQFIIYYFIFRPTQTDPLWTTVCRRSVRNRTAGLHRPRALQHNLYLEAHWSRPANHY